MNNNTTSDFIDWNDAFENGSYIANSSTLPEQWAKASEQLRTHCLQEGRLSADIAYGSDPRQQLDLFHPSAPSKGLLVLVHGGYWLKFDKSYWSFLASACLSHGWSVAIPSYRLAPAVSMADITQDIRSAIVTAAEQLPGPVRLTGHSAGGHLVARMLCRDHALPKAVYQRIEHVVPISGLFDLRPLMATTMNESLQLDKEQAQVESPVFHPPNTEIKVSLWVGAEERPEFLRQTRLMCEGWHRQGATVQAHYEPGKNHFSVIDGLTEADSALVSCLLGKVG